MNRRNIIRILRAKGVEFDHHLSTNDLNDLLKQSDIINKVSRTTNFSSGTGKITIAYNAAKADDPVTVMVCEDIGKDAWTGEGFCLKDLQEALKDVDTKRDLDFQVNSAGGYVSAGTAIRNWLANWGGGINQTIIGVAASTASWCIPADKTRAFKNSQIFMHRAMAAPFGNVDDLQDAITQLTKTDGQIAAMYAEQSEATPDEMLDLMKGANGQGTLLTGQEALDAGLVDELVDGEAKNNFSADWLNSARQKLSTLNTLRNPQANPPPTATGNQPPTQTQTIMNKEKMIALLNKWGVTVPANATDEQLLALVEAGPKTPTPTNAAPALDAETNALLEGMKNQIANARRKDIREAVNKVASEGRIPATEIENWENDAVAASDHPTNGNPVLARLNKLESHKPGISPLPSGLNKLEVANADVKDITRGFEAHNEASASFMRGNEVSMKDIGAAAVNKANFFKKFRNRLMEMLNTNTIDAGLQRQLILQDVVIRDFVRRVLGLDMFSTVFRNVPLQGLNTVEVPYFDLDSSASTNFVSGTGYTTIGNTSSGKKEITVGENATNGKRKYQALQFSSQEIARQPYLKIAQLAGLKAEKLAYDIEQDILGCILATNFGAAAVTKAAALFTSDDLADLKVACKAWPMEGRGLILDSAYDANLLKDPAFKFALNAASDSAIKEGRLYPRVFGYDYVENPNIPQNGENLVGFAFWKYAILIAFAPVPPVDEVRRAGTTWELITDPATGISLEYRAFGDNVKDQATHVIESSYGFAHGLATALKRIVTP